LHEAAAEYEGDPSLDPLSFEPPEDTAKNEPGRDWTRSAVSVMWVPENECLAVDPSHRTQVGEIESHIDIWVACAVVRIGRLLDDVAADITNQHSITEADRLIGVRKEVVCWNPLSAPMTKTVGKRGPHGVHGSRLNRAPQPRQPVDVG
jgi:hypothetical protein